VVTISTDKLIENPETKKIYGSSDDSTLKLSISLLGVLEPLIVFQVGDSDQYQIISGNRRLSVAKELGLSELPATIINPKNIDKVITIGHNEQRRKLPSHYIREYRTYNDLHNLTQGKKSTESKEAIEQRNQLFRDIAKSTLDRYLSIDRIDQKMADGIKKFLDLDKNIETTELLMAYIKKTYELVELERSLETLSSRIDAKIS
jgi:ParB family chromosome partitioning protein